MMIQIGTFQVCNTLTVMELIYLMMIQIGTFQVCNTRTVMELIYLMMVKIWQVQVSDVFLLLLYLEIKSLIIAMIKEENQVDLGNLRFLSLMDLIMSYQIFPMGDVHLGY